MSQATTATSTYDSLTSKFNTKFPDYEKGGVDDLQRFRGEVEWTNYLMKAQQEGSLPGTFTLNSIKELSKKFLATYDQFKVTKEWISALITDLTQGIDSIKKHDFTAAHAAASHLDPEATNEIMGAQTTAHTSHISDLEYMLTKVKVFADKYFNSRLKAVEVHLFPQASFMERALNGMKDNFTDLYTKLVAKLEREETSTSAAAASSSASSSSGTIELPPTIDSKYKELRVYHLGAFQNSVRRAEELLQFSKELEVTVEALPAQISAVEQQLTSRSNVPITLDDIEGTLSPTVVSRCLSEGDILGTQRDFVNRYAIVSDVGLLLTETRQFSQQLTLAIEDISRTTHTVNEGALATGKYFDPNAGNSLENAHQAALRAKEDLSQYLTESTKVSQTLDTLPYQIRKTYSGTMFLGGGFVNLSDTLLQKLKELKSMLIQNGAQRSVRASPITPVNLASTMVLTDLTIQAEKAAGQLQEALQARATARTSTSAASASTAAAAAATGSPVKPAATATAAKPAAAASGGKAGPAAPTGKSGSAAKK